MFSVTASASATPPGLLPPLAKTGFLAATSKQSLVPPFMPVSLAFKNINFYVPAPKVRPPNRSIGQSRADIISSSYLQHQEGCRTANWIFEHIFSTLVHLAALLVAFN